MHTPTALLFQDFRCSQQPEVNENYVSFLWYNNVHGQDMSMSMVDPREQGGAWKIRIPGKDYNPRI